MARKTLESDRIGEQIATLERDIESLSVQRSEKDVAATQCADDEGRYSKVCEDIAAIDSRIAGLRERIPRLNSLRHAAIEHERQAEIDRLSKSVEGIDEKRIAAKSESLAKVEAITLKRDREIAIVELESETFARDVYSTRARLFRLKVESAEYRLKIANDEDRESIEAERRECIGKANTMSSLSDQAAGKMSEAKAKLELIDRQERKLQSVA